MRFFLLHLDEFLRLVGSLQALNQARGNLYGDSPLSGATKKATDNEKAQKA